MLTIGITYTGTGFKQQNYVNWLKSSGEDIHIITLSAEAGNLDKISECDGLLLSGGLDIRPDLYVGKLDYKNAPEEFKPSRDEFELASYRAAQEKHIPVLGVCRGLQLINCAEGGNLQQDMGDPLNDTHWAMNKPPDKSHKVKVEKNTALYGFTLMDSGFVNSAHHQTVNRLGKGLMVNCRAEDGSVEGIEWADKEGKPFLLGVQWHPERMYQLGLESSPLSKNLRDHFIKEIVQHKKAKQ